MTQALKRVGDRMEVENMLSAKGNTIANQFVITDGSKKVFQSYRSKIATLENSILTLVGHMWDYSNTTRKYFKDFINDETSFVYNNKAQWEREIVNNPAIVVAE